MGTVNWGVRSSRAPRAVWIILLLASAISLAGCGISAPAPSIAVSESPTPVPTATPALRLTPPPARCADGRLRIRDLETIGQEWTAGVQSAIEVALAWRPDARLV